MSYELSAVSCQLSAFGYQLSAFGCRRSARFQQVGWVAMGALGLELSCEHRDDFGTYG